MANSEILLIILSAILLVNSAVNLLVSLVTAIAAYQLLRYARDTDKLLDEIIATCQKLGTVIELAIWRG